MKDSIRPTPASPPPDGGNAGADLPPDQQSVAESEQRLRQIIDLVPHCIFAKDPEGRITLANQAVADFNGTTVDALLGKTDRELSFSEAEARRFRQSDLRVMKTGKALHIPTEIVTDAQGEEHVIQTTKIPFTSSASGEPAVLGVAVDVTERLRDEARLLLQAQLLDNVGDAILATDLDCQVIHWGKGAERLYGRSADEAMGKSITFILDESELEPEKRRIEQVLKTGSWRGQCRQRRRDGSRFVSETTISLVRDSDGFPQGFLGVNRDITERLSAERALRERNRLLETLNAVAQVTTGSMSVAEMCDRLLEIVRREMPCDAMLVGSYDQSQGLVHPLRCYDTFTGEPEPVEIASPMVPLSCEQRRTVLEGRQSLLVERGNGGDKTDELHPFGDTSRRSKTLIFAPLVAGNRVLGFLTVQSYEPQAYTQAHLDLLTAIAQQAGPAIEAAMLAEQLRHSEATYRAAIEASAGVPYRLLFSPKRGQGTYEFMGARVEQLVGIPAGELTQEKLWRMAADVHRIRPPFDCEPGELRRRDWIGDANNYEAEVLMRLPSGEERWLSDHSVPLRDEQTGQIIGSLGILHDITERKSAEQRLRESEERLRAVVHTMPVLCDAFDGDGNILAWNSECENVTGYSAEEIVGNPQALELLYPDPVARARMMAEWQERGNTFRGWELTLTAKDGARKTIAWSNLSEEHPIAGWWGWRVGVDITDRRRLEKEILEISDREQRRIGQDLHDGPCQQITAVLLMAKALEKTLAAGKRPEPDQLSRIEEILADTLEQIRRLARSLYLVDLEEHGLHSALQALAERTEGLHGLSCSLSIGPGFERIGVEMATHLCRLAQEALNNVLKHADASHVTIELASGGGHCRLEVADDGRGLPDVAERGEGMGIPIMRHRAKMIGASLDIRPRPAGGTAVTCLFRAPNGASPEEPR